MTSSLDNSPALEGHIGSYQKGISFACWSADQYSTPSSFASLVNLQKTGAEWVAIIVTWYEESFETSAMFPHPVMTPSDASLMAVVQHAHALGLKVMLKPHIDVDGDGWRGNISPKYPDRWFTNYSAFIQHYANMAEKNFVEQFCVGVELRNLSGYERNWKRVIDVARSAYTGPITYAANYDEYRYVSFWDYVDYIGIDGFFPVSNKANPDLFGLILGWQPYLKDLLRWYQENGKFGGKRIIFTEIGYASVEGSSMQPWNARMESTVSLSEQETCYHAALELLRFQDWLGGIFWWVWPADTNVGVLNSDFSIYGKPAEATLQSYWKVYASTKDVRQK